MAGAACGLGHQHGCFSHGLRRQHPVVRRLQCAPLRQPSRTCQHQEALLLAGRAQRCRSLLSEWVRSRKAAFNTLAFVLSWLLGLPASCSSPLRPSPSSRVAQRTVTLAQPAQNEIAPDRSWGLSSLGRPAFFALALHDSDTPSCEDVRALASRSGTR